MRQSSCSLLPILAAATSLLSFFQQAAANPCLQVSCPRYNSFGRGPAVEAGRDQQDMVCYYPGASGCAYQINDINLFLEDPYDSPGCPSHATCTQCKPQFILVDGLCQCPAPLSYSGFEDTCHLKCPVGTQNLNDQSCQPCNKAAGEVSSGGFFGKCVTCPMGQIPNSDNSACVLQPSRAAVRRQLQVKAKRHDYWR